MDQAGSSGLTESLVLEADVDKIMGVLLDFESYPDWMSNVVGMEVLERDKKGRGTDVRYKVDVIVKKISYVLKYTYDDKANRIDLGFIEGELDDVNSYYLFEPLDDDRTEVTYHYDVKYSIPRALVNPITKRLMKQVDKKVMKSALKDLKTRVESM